MARMKYESERDAKRAVKSSEFLAKKREERLQRQEARRQQYLQSEAARQFEAANTPIPRAEFDPEIDDYHQSGPSPKRLPSISEDPNTEGRSERASVYGTLQGNQLNPLAVGCLRMWLLNKQVI